MSNEKRKIGNLSVRVVTPENSDDSVFTPEDKDMDKRISEAVKSAIKRATVCKAPVAKYDKRKKKVYVITATGEKKYVS